MTDQDPRHNIALKLLQQIGIKSDRKLANGQTIEDRLLDELACTSGSGRPLPVIHVVLGVIAACGAQRAQTMIPPGKGGGIIYGMLLGDTPMNRAPESKAVDDPEEGHDKKSAELATMAP